MRRWGLGEWPELNEGAVFQDFVPKSSAGRTLLEFYTSRHPRSASRAGWAQRVRAGQVSVNDVQTTDTEQLLTQGDSLEYRRLPWSEPDAPCLFEILFEDEHLLVVNKPSGLQVIRGGAFHQRTLLTLLEAYHCCTSQGTGAEVQTSAGLLNLLECVGTSTLGTHGDSGLGEGKVGTGSNGFNREADVITRDSACAFIAVDASTSVPTPVHRLGRGTSGIVVCAKTAQARASLSAAFAKDAADASGGSGGRRKGEQKTKCRATAPMSQSSSSNDTIGLNDPCSSDSRKQKPGGLKKVYRGLLQGLVLEDKVHITTPIGKVPFPGVAGGLFAACPGGKPAWSCFRVLHRNPEENTTLVEVDLFTGRAHQIRIHSACMGHPLVGDPLYRAGGVPGVEILGKGGSPIGHGSESMRYLDGGGESRSAGEDHRQADDALGSSGHLGSLSIAGMGLNQERWCEAVNSLRDATVAADGGHFRSLDPLPGDCGYVLHAFEITFYHPVSGDAVHLVAPPPAPLGLPEEKACEW